jgi:hypothetical protein
MLVIITCQTTAIARRQWQRDEQIEGSITVINAAVKTEGYARYSVFCINLRASADEDAEKQHFFPCLFLLINEIIPEAPGQSVASKKNSKSRNVYLDSK